MSVESARLVVIEFSDNACVSLHLSSQKQWTFENNFNKYHLIAEFASSALGIELVDGLRFNDYHTGNKKLKKMR